MLMSHLFNESEASNPSKDFSRQVPKDQIAQWTFCLKVSQVTSLPTYPKCSHFFCVCLSLGFSLSGVTIVSSSSPKPETCQPVIPSHFQPVTKPWQLCLWQLPFLRPSSPVQLLFLSLESYCLCLENCSRLWNPSITTHCLRGIDPLRSGLCPPVCIGHTIPLPLKPWAFETCNFFLTSLLW